MARFGESHGLEGRKPEDKERQIGAGGDLPLDCITTHLVPIILHVDVTKYVNAIFNVLALARKGQVDFLVTLVNTMITNAYGLTSLLPAS